MLKINKIMVMLSFFVINANFANAHIAESGMKYSTYCCNDLDCKSLKEWNKHERIVYKLEETDDGYVVTLNGEQFGTITPYDSEYILKSTDGQIHLCLIRGDDMDDYEQVRCIYLPESFV